MKFKLTVVSLMTFAVIFFSSFCSTSVDTNSDFAMVLNGRVKGTILSATLFGYYQSQDAMEPIAPEDPKKLEIYNFPFDATFESSMF